MDEEGQRDAWEDYARLVADPRAEDGVQEVDRVCVTNFCGGVPSHSRDIQNLKVAPR